MPHKLTKQELDYFNMVIEGLRKSMYDSKFFEATYIQAEKIVYRAEDKKEVLPKLRKLLKVSKHSGKEMIEILIKGIENG